MINNAIPLKIAGVGYSVPETVVTNDDLTKLYDTSDEWIYTRTGIKERRLVSGNESAVDLGFQAAQKALEKSGKSVEDMRNEKREDALKSVKIRLALQEIINLEKIDFTDKEVDEKVKEMAKSANKTIKEYKNSLTEQHMNYIKNDILMTKLMNFLVEND